MIAREMLWYGFGALLRPSDIEHFQVILHYTNFFLLVRLIEIFQNDGNVHINDNHVTDYYETGEVGDGQQGMATIPVGLSVKVWITVRRLYHQRFQHVVPPGRCHEAKQQLHAAAKCLEVYHVI